MRGWLLVLALGVCGCGIKIDLNPSDDEEDEDDEDEWMGGSDDEWPSSSGGGSGGSSSGGSSSGGSSSGGSSGEGSSGEGSSGEGSTGGGSGGGSGTDGGSGTPSGDGSFDVDTLFVMWGAVYRDGEPVDADYRTEDGDLESVEPTFSFIWIDSDDYSEGDDTYICRLRYDNYSAAYVADFSDFEGGDSTYLSFLMDLGADEPEEEGNCAGASSHFGVGSMVEAVGSTPWGYGYGPMTDVFEDELSEVEGVDYPSLGDAPGVTYLRWQSSEGDEYTAWGYFRVIPFESDGSDILQTIEEPSDFVSGVRDSAEPSDGYYDQKTVYVLTYSR